MGECRGDAAAWQGRAHAHVWPGRGEMHDGAAEDRSHHSGKGRSPLIKKSKGDQFMIYVVATSHVKPECRDAFIKGARDCIATTRQEKGCISYENHTSIN